MLPVLLITKNNIIKTEKASNDLELGKVWISAPGKCKKLEIKNAFFKAFGIEVKKINSARVRKKIKKTKKNQATSCIDRNSKYVLSISDRSLIEKLEM
jgi:ribosomal protein L23